ncbi:MAG: polysaccharide deacetylase family protein [Rhodospirillum sp.]|nr:polysaccharide deacetylase family protein [Rhodospirillum sp.]MCF8487811.1 polysaccharide deacetylase family protein [Rhodospirillum sp.]MCF8499909.1 polysaccharide deacetylase family protein [Rhodospirillum sp.]
MLSIEYHLVTEHPSIKRIPSIGPEKLELQIQKLKSVYNPLTPDDILALSVGTKEYPKDSFFLTFDDSFAPTVDCALPILKEHGLKGCFFVYTEVIGRSFLTTLEKQRVLQYMAGPYELFLENFKRTSLSLYDSLPKDIFTCSQDRYEAIIGSYLAEWSFYTLEERYYRFLRDTFITPDQCEVIFTTMFKERFTSSEEKDLANALYISPDQLLRIKSEGHAIGGHSHSHPFSLTGLDDRNLSHELIHSKELIEQIIEDEVTFLAYPNGHVDNRVIDEAKRAGYLCGFSTINDLCTLDRAFNIPRRDAADLPKFLQV